MVAWLKTSPEEKDKGRGRVSYPLMRDFLHMGLESAKLDRSALGLKQPLQSLCSCLSAYIKSHELPVRIFQRGGEIYASRTDIDSRGNPNSNHNDINRLLKPRAKFPKQNTNTVSSTSDSISA